MTDTITLHVGRRIRARRRQMSLTQRDLAESVGVRFQQIQKYECGANRITADRLWSISQALAVPVGELFPQSGEAGR
jgi:transcriptional regulator with XRE-family HTH domain